MRFRCTRKLSLHFYCRPIMRECCFLFPTGFVPYNRTVRARGAFTRRKFHETFEVANYAGFAVD